MQVFKSLGRFQLLLAAALSLFSCASLPDPKVTHYPFPKNAFTGDVQRAYTVLGPVKSKVDYTSLDPGHDEKELCKNYYNKGVRELLNYARKQGGNAVIAVESVVFLEDGRRETYKTAECSDDGSEGQILLQGIAVKWIGDGTGSGTWSKPAVAAQTAGPKVPLEAEKKPQSLGEPLPLVITPTPAEAVPESKAPVAAVAQEPAASSTLEPVKIEMEAAAPAASLQRTPAAVAPSHETATRASPATPAETAASNSAYRMADPRSLPFLRRLP